MAFLVLFFIVALSLCVVGLIVIALAAIWESVREENCKNSNEKRALKTIDWTAWSEASARSTWRSCRSCYASPDSIMRYLGRAFYAAVAAAIAHSINTTRQLAAMYSKGVMAPSPRYPAWQSSLSRDICATGLCTSTGSTSVGIRIYQVAACGGLGNAKSS